MQVAKRLLKDPNERHDVCGRGSNWILDHGSARSCTSCSAPSILPPNVYVRRRWPYPTPLPIPRRRRGSAPQFWPKPIVSLLTPTAHERPGITAVSRPALTAGLWGNRLPSPTGSPSCRLLLTANSTILAFNQLQDAICSLVTLFIRSAAKHHIPSLSRIARFNASCPSGVWRSREQNVLLASFS